MNLVYKIWGTARRAAWVSALLLVPLLWLATPGGTAYAADGPIDDRPFTENWFPTEWGPDDKIGAVNRINPCTIMAALKLVKKGRATVLGKIYERVMPTFGIRSWRIAIPGLPTVGPLGENAILGNEELVTAELGQIGTQFDGPGHIGVRTSRGDIFYNGRVLQEVSTAYGTGPLGVEFLAMKPFICRGILLNAAALRGVEMLPMPKGGRDDPGNITDDDIRAMVNRQGLGSIETADCVFVYTGWGNIWDPVKWGTFSLEERLKRIAQFKPGEPGLGLSACRYLVERKIVLVGSDNWGIDSIPGEDPKRPFDCHIEMQTRHGIWAIENLQFVDLMAEGQDEFLFVWSALPMKGATGSPANPIAMW